MSVFRQDPTNGSWVLIAPERGRRPSHWRNDGAGAGPQPSFDPACPFCPGNERMLPGIIAQTPAGGTWLTRVVPNKYPALRADNNDVAPSGGQTLKGYGSHEVIIETARHDGDLARLSGEALAAVVRTYRERYVALSARPGVKSVIVFRNHGQYAGGSIPHAHAQVIAMGTIPPRLAAASAWAGAHHARHGRCATCEALAADLKDGRRVVEVSERFAVVVPFAAASPFEQHILPRRHQASFAQADDEELIEFGRLLQRALRRLAAAADNPPYNFAIESASASDGDAYTHWGLRIAPHVTTPGGFELGAGMAINPSLPEDDAGILRGVGLEDAP